MRKKLFWLLFTTILGVNGVAFIHAYQFTHFSKASIERTKDPGELSGVDKARILLAGIDNPRPKHVRFPERDYQIIHIESDVVLEAWHVPADAGKGTVILFHGYAGEKSSLISRAELFSSLGYHTLLVDFKGSGGSEGKSTSIGYSEAREVNDCYNYVRSTGEKNIHLFGTSMGAAAILKAMDEFAITPSSIILECPFGSLYKTVCARFRMMGVPSFPMAGVLTFWGGFQHGYWAFGHNPQKYAQRVSCPALLMYGEQDDRVSMEETQTIYQNLKGSKTLITYPEEGHNIFTAENELNWKKDVTEFLINVE